MIKIFARLLNYLDRGKNNFGSVQQPITVMIFLGVYKDTVIGIWIFSHSLITIPAIIILLFAVLIISGYLEYKFKVIERKNELENENNPMLKEILRLLKEKQ